MIIESNKSNTQKYYSFHDFYIREMTPNEKRNFKYNPQNISEDWESIIRVLEERPDLYIISYDKDKYKYDEEYMKVLCVER